VTKDPPATAGTRETWRAWLPPGHPEPPLITRDELLDALARRDLAMPARTLQRWEAAGALPAPIRRRHDGAPRTLSVATEQATGKRGHAAAGTGLAGCLSGAPAASVPSACASRPPRVDCRP
jgi:hypothetical protein